MNTVLGPYLTALASLLKPWLQFFIAFHLFFYMKWVDVNYLFIETCME